MAFFRALKSFN